MNSAEFICKLNSLLPDGFEAKKFKNMPRIHIKYLHYGFVVIDLCSNFYNLFAIEGLFPAIGVRNFEQISNMGNKTTRVMHIDYDDTKILEKLFDYVRKNPLSVESVAVQSY